MVLDKLISSMKLNPDEENQENHEESNTNNN